MNVGILAMCLIFGSGTAIAISFSAIGRAIADRISGRLADTEPDPRMLEELDRLRIDMNEVQERLEFAERMLSAQREQHRIEGAS